MSNIKKNSGKKVKIYEFSISLQHIRPLIWRKIQVKNNITLDILHLYINEAMGWTNSHLHEFIIEGKHYGIPDLDYGKEEFGYELINDEIIEIDKVITYEKQKIKYEYDFGDGWEHLLILEKILDLESNIKYPRCIAGRKACPPEDCGGYAGYEDICKLMNNPNNPKYDGIITWLGDKKYDPEFFDLDDTDNRVKDAIETYNLYNS